MKRVLIGLAVVILLLVVVDRAADFAAGRYAADRVAEQMRTDGGVTVDFRGFPFLIQAARRTFDRVDISADGPHAGQLRIEHLDARASEARVLSADAVRVRSLSGRALLTYPDVTAATRGEAEVSYGGDGLLKITRTVTVLGQEASVSALGTASARDGVLTVRPVRFDSVSGPVRDLLRRVPLGRFQISVAMPQVPRGITVTVDPGEDGIALPFQGTDVLLTRS